MKFEKQATGIAQGVAFRVPAPQGSGLGETVGAGGRYPVGFASFGPTWAARTRWGDAAETRLRGRTRRRLRACVHRRLLTEMDGVRGGARPRDLLSSRIVASVADVTDGRGRSVCTADATALRPVLWRCHRLRTPNRHLLFGRASWVPGRHRVEMSTYIRIPCESVAPKIEGRIIHSREICLHHHRPLGESASFIVFVIRVFTKGEHVLIAWRVHTVRLCIRILGVEDLRRIDVLHGESRTGETRSCRRSATCGGVEQGFVGGMV